MFLFFAILGATFISQPSFASSCLNDQDLQRLSRPLESNEEAQTLIKDLGIGYRNCKNLRGLFAEVYTSTLDAIQNKIKNNHFENTELVKKMLVTHTNLYREALYLEQTHQLNKAPIAWRHAFNALKSDEYKPGTLLILSMNAHIAFDMAKTLIQMNISFESKSAKRDYQRITQILRDSMDSLWDAFRIYDHNPLVIPKSAELKLMVEWASWMRNKAWKDASICARNKTQIHSCLKSLDEKTGDFARYYKNLDLIVH